MVKKPDKSTGQTREQLLDAALATLRRDGFAAATSRAIAREADVNPALIFYHFGSVDGLLLAALDRTSAERLRRYREAVDEAETLEQLVAVAGRVYEEDRAAGHMTVVAQMLAGSVARPELAPEMVRRMDPWLELAEEAIEKVQRRLDVPELVPVRELAYAFVTFYLGVNFLTHLDGERAPTEALFRRLEELAALGSAFGRGGTGEAR